MGSWLLGFAWGSLELVLLCHWTLGIFEGGIISSNFTYGLYVPRFIAGEDSELNLLNSLRHDEIALLYV